MKSTFKNCLFINWVFILMLLNKSVCAQKTFHDQSFENWITSSNHKYKYYVLLNPNLACYTCFKNQLNAILSNKLYDKIGIVTYPDVFQHINLKNTQNLNIIFKERADFDDLGFLRYRNALLQYKKEHLQLILNLKPQNASLLVELVR